MTNARIEQPSASGIPIRRFAYPMQATFLSQAVLLEEVGPPRVPAFVCLFGFALVCIAMIAASMIRIDVVSITKGTIVSSTPNHVLRSFDGGIVDQINVDEGQIVDAGDLLLTLHDPEAEAQLDRLQARQKSLTAQAERFRSLADLSRPPQSPERIGATALEHEQMAILPLEEAAIAAERSLARAEINRRIEGLASLRALKETARPQIDVVNQKLDSQRRLHAKGLASKSALLEAEREAMDTRFDLSEIEGQIRDAEASVKEAGQRLEDVIAARRERQGERLSGVLVELSELNQQIGATLSRLRRGAVRASVRGLVQELVARHPGQTVAPGERLVELVPIDAELVVEARLSPTEIGQVRPRQPVRIAIDGMDPHRHGYAQGSVKRLSPSTFIDDNRLPYYRVILEISANDLDGVTFIPGMTVQGQIRTDQRTMMDYLTKPIYRAWNTAFRER